MYRLELTKCTYQWVGPPFIGSGQQLIPVISSYYQQLSVVGKSGGGKWGDALLLGIGLTNMSKSWGAITAIASIAPLVTPAPTADSPEPICKLSLGLHINKGQSYLPLRERTLAPIKEYFIVQNKCRPYDYWLKIWGIQCYQRPYFYWIFDRAYRLISVRLWNFKDGGV